MKQLLQAALAILEAGWCKGTMSQQGRHCIAGAVWAACGQQRAAYMGALHRIERVCGRPVGAYNDDPRTTHEDVLRTMRKAIQQS